MKEVRAMRVGTHIYRGQIVVVMTGAIAVLLGAIALCTDVGLLYWNWGLLQKAADASVLAGGNYLPSDPATSVSVATNYAGLNGIASNEIVSTNVASDNMSISIQLRRRVPYYFAQLVGLSSGVVTARASAGLQSVSSVNQLVPVGIDSRTTYTYGQQVNLTTGQYGPGNWGPLAFGDTGASTFASNVQYGYVGQFSIGQMLLTQPGMMTGPTRTAFNARIIAGADMYPDGTFASHSMDDPRLLTVPMVDYADINGSSQVPLLGFAELWLASIDSNLTITTYFIRQVANGTPSPNAPNYGAWQVVLIK